MVLRTTRTITFVMLTTSSQLSMSSTDSDPEVYPALISVNSGDLDVAQRAQEA